MYNIPQKNRRLIDIEFVENFAPVQPSNLFAACAATLAASVVIGILFFSGTELKNSKRPIFVETDQPIIKEMAKP